MSWPAVKKKFSASTFPSYLAGLKPPVWARFVTVHNTGAPDLATYRGYSARKNPVSDLQWLKNLEGYYKNEQHWSGGPHLFITPNSDGICVFNDLTQFGTHSPSWNRVALGVEIVGDFDRDAFADGSKANTIAALAALHEWLGLDPSTMRFHKEDAHTTHKDCPGRNVVKADLIKAVKAQMYTRTPVAFGVDPGVVLDGTRDDHAAVDGELAPRPGIVQTIKDSKIAKTGIGIGLGDAGDLASQANDAVNQVKQVKGSAEDLGIWDVAVHLAHSPRFWFSFAILVAIGLVVYWRWRDHT